MSTVQQLYINSTNRLPLIPEPFLNTNILCHNNKIYEKSSQQSNQIQILIKNQKIIEQQIDQAKEQYKIMFDLFSSFEKIQKGQIKQTKKLQRRCMKDILDKIYCMHTNCNKYYSSLPSLQRHIRLKHSCNKNQPPLLYHDLRPQPNLTQLNSQTNEQLESQSEEEMIGQSKYNDLQ